MRALILDQYVDETIQQWTNYLYKFKSDLDTAGQVRYAIACIPVNVVKVEIQSSGWNTQLL